MQQKLIFLDTETTGRGPQDRLIQLCISDSFTEPFVKLYKPPVAISFEAMAVHHITEDIVKDSENFGDVNRVKIQTIIDGNIVVAHNAPFDIEILKREGITVGPFIDTLKVAQYLWDEPSYKLQYLRYRFDLKVNGKAHDAEGDVAVLEALFKFELAEMEISVADMLLGHDWEEQAINKMIEISGLPTLLRRMPFGKHKDMAFNQIPKDYLDWLNKQSDLSEDLKHTLGFYLKPKVEPKQAIDQQKLL